LVKESKGKIATGFLGTPIILDAMSRNGHVDAAFTMLLREEMPSWLYPISKGATTIWERWNGIMPDGSINGGAMDSTAEGSGDSTMLTARWSTGFTATSAASHRQPRGTKPSALHRTHTR
jgi:alpha-L-rhamnosidase